MTRVAVFTPLPPSPSGIAQYSAELLPLLARELHLDVYIADDAPPPDPAPTWATVRLAREFPAAQAAYTAVIYQLGNNPAHAYVLDHLAPPAQSESDQPPRSAPGICILHDVTLQHLHRWRAARDGPTGFRAYRAEMARRYGTAGAAAVDAFAANRDFGADGIDFPLCERAVERSRAVIVHSGYARDRLLARCPAAPVTVIPHGVPLLPPGDRTATRAALGLPAGAFVVAAVGNLIPEKRLEVALRAFARTLFRLPAGLDALFVIAGAASEHYSPASFIRLHGLDPIIRQLGAVDAATFEALLVAADACVNLRWPTGGETSGSLLRALAAGRPTLVTDAGSFAEVPDDACLKVPLGPHEEDTVAAHLLRLASEPARAKAIGAQARAFIAREHTLERAAEGYLAVVRNCAGK